MFDNHSGGRRHKKHRGERKEPLHHNCGACGRELSCRRQARSSLICDCAEKLWAAVLSGSPVFYCDRGCFDEASRDW